jgi:membrane protein YdbS with pleckstrin-like domain
MDATDDLTPLDPAYVKVLRIGAALPSLLSFAVALTLEIFADLPGGVFTGPALLLGVLLVLVLPPRSYRRWGYRLGADRLQVVRGFLFHADTVVPLGRVQHIDVHQGPVMRRYGLATLTVHTAGNHTASLALPGLPHADALAMREAIRAHIAAAQA